MFDSLFLKSVASAADGMFVTPRMSSIGTGVRAMILWEGSHRDRMEEDFLLIPKDVSRAVQPGTKNDVLSGSGQETLRGAVQL